MEPNITTFAEALKQTRKMLKITQTQLADKMHLSPATLRNYEKGSSIPRMSTMQTICATWPNMNIHIIRAWANEYINQNHAHTNLKSTTILSFWDDAWVKTWQNELQCQKREESAIIDHLTDICTAAKFESRITAEWMPHSSTNEYDHYYECSNCKYEEKDQICDPVTHRIKNLAMSKQRKFCPRCGAKMTNNPMHDPHITAGFIRSLKIKASLRT